MTKKDVWIQELPKRLGIEEKKVAVMLEAAIKKDPCNELDEQLTADGESEYRAFLREMPKKYIEFMWKGIMGHAMSGGTSGRH